MSETASLVAENLSQFCPVTNLYSCSDGKYLLVTIPTVDAGELLSALGIQVPIAQSHLPRRADVFLANEDGEVLDADGDPANGMTALAKIENCSSFEHALAHLGYTLVA